MTTSTSTPIAPTPTMAPTTATVEGSQLSASASIDQARARRLLDRALTLSQQGDRPAAIVACRQAVSLAPQEASGYSILGMLLEQSGDVAGAITAYQKVLELKVECEAEREALQRLSAIAGPTQAAAGAANADLNAGEGQVALQPELSDQGDLNAPPELVVAGRSTFRTRILPILVVSALSLVAIAWTIRAKQAAPVQPATTTTAGGSSVGPATGAPATASTGTLPDSGNSATASVGTGPATAAAAGAGGVALTAPATGGRTQIAGPRVRVQRRSTTSPAPGYSQAVRPPARGAAPGVVQPAQPAGSGVAPPSSPPQEATSPAPVDDGGASPNGKPFVPNGSGSQGFIRITPPGTNAQ